MTNDPIAIIKQDHRTVESLFKEYEGLGDSAYAHKRQLADTIITELTNHAEMEELYSYPRFKEAFDTEEDKMVEEATAEHEVAKHLMAELKTLSPEDPQFDAKMTVLSESIAHHVKEEEEELLPQAEEELDEETLATMGDEMVAFKESLTDLIA